MALYENNLFLSRALAHGPLLPEMFSSGVLQAEDDNTAQVAGQVRCIYREYENREYAAYPLTVVKLALDDPQFERMLQSKAQVFLLWLWHLLEQHNVIYAFMGGGSSYEGYYDKVRITDKIVYPQIGELVAKGTVKFAHPVMFFSNSIADGKICQLAQRAPLYSVETKPGIGCLLVLVRGELNANSIEILQPGLVYPRLKRHFHKTLRFQ